MRRFNLIKLTLIFSLLANVANSQESAKGNVNAHFGTLGVYSAYSLGYETPTLLKFDKHKFRINARFGGWSSSFTEKNNGSLASIGGTYLFGNKHHLEFSSDAVFHFDRGLKGQTITYIAAWYRPFLGYRYESETSRFMGRIGVGWKEVFQVGIGYKL